MLVEKGLESQGIMFLEVYEVVESDSDATSIIWGQGHLMVEGRVKIIDKKLRGQESWIIPLLGGFQGQEIWFW